MRIHCKIFGHDYVVKREVTYYVKEYSCKHCKRELTTNGSGNLIDLTPKFKEINDVLERIHKKRQLRKAFKIVRKGNALPEELLVFSHQ